MFSLCPCSQSPFPPWESQSTSPPQDALQLCADLWTCCGGAQVQIWSYSCVFLPPMSTAIKASVFLCGSSQWPFIYSIDTVCLVDRVDLTCSWYGWWEGFGSSSLATLPLGFNCGFSSTSAHGGPLGFSFSGCPGGLGFGPVRARCGGGAAAWVAGVLAAPGTQRVGS